MVGSDGVPGVVNTAEGLRGTVNLVQAGQVDTVIFGSPGGVAAVVTPLPTPAALAAEVFVGRGAEIATLLDRLAPAPAMSTPVVAGMGGTGKTTLVRRVGATAVERGWFLGGALFVDLDGYAANPQQRVQPDQLFGPLLRALGVAERHIPTAPGEQAAVYHRVLADRADQRQRVLVVLDNVSTADQVRSLLPQQEAHRVLITTRDTLALPPADLLNLGVLDPDHALELVTSTLRRRNHTDLRADQDETGLRRISELCAGLPLAVEIAAALLADDPDLTVDELVEELEQARLSTLARGEASVAHTLALSWHRLRENHPEAARLVRLLAAAPGPTLSTDAAAVLADVTPAQVRPWLRTLRQAHLLQQQPGGRWALHDLIRHHLADVADGPDTDDMRAAVDRLLDFYLATTHAADLQLRIPPAAPATRFTGRDDALSWLDTEHATLITAVTHAAATNRLLQAVGLAAYLAEYLGRRRHHTSWLTITRCALHAFQELGDRGKEGHAWANLGLGLREVGRYDEAVPACRQALAIFRDVGDLDGEAAALDNLGGALRELGHFEEAVAACQQAQEYFGTRGDRAKQATALNNLGLALKDTGRFEQAIAVGREARRICHDIGDRDGEATALNNLAFALRESGQVEEAITSWQSAADICRDIGDHHGEATASYNLGLNLYRVGRFDQAVTAWQRARDRFHDLGDLRTAADTWNGLSHAFRKLGRFADAADACVEASDLRHALGDLRGEADALAGLTIALREAGREQEAEHAAARARQAFLDAGDPPSADL